eukprot:scaffold29619_cov63-Attheya_sp.AAC.12
MARLVIGVAIGMGVCPIAASGPQSLDGIGGLLSAENVEVVAWLVPQYWLSALDEVPSLLLIFLRAWLPCGLMQCWRLDVVLHGHGCNVTEVGASAEG